MVTKQGVEAQLEAVRLLWEENPQYHFISCFILENFNLDEVIFGTANLTISYRNFSISVKFIFVL